MTSKSNSPPTRGCTRRLCTTYKSQTAPDTWVYRASLHLGIELLVALYSHVSGLLVNSMNAFVDDKDNYAFTRSSSAKTGRAVGYRD